MFITNAYAQAAGAQTVGSFSSKELLTSVFPFILIFVIMYFLIIRPQRAQMKKRQEMLNAVRRGDTVVTGGGVVGKVMKVNDASGELEVEISEGIRIHVLRSTLSDVRVKGEPLSEEKSKSDVTMKTQKKSKAKTVTKENVAMTRKKKDETKTNESDA
ncbi:preprotein translocase subunit YajC [Bartonella sp. F02]|uniref:preprotein translocase subunit YajC n=1 Tax=Bartonella sp. F02 TaxID=2967262 RepID=UPI0022A9B1AD|nr:preprotein translocase subunit YajC [Bartonella sp. F02]MCZ2328579.1 preprotein translocase subunit YajC [Bartonella sp. F02]